MDSEPLPSYHEHNHGATMHRLRSIPDSIAIRTERISGD